MRKQTNRSIIITIFKTTKINVVLLIEFRIFNAIETIDSNNFKNRCKCFVDFVLIHFFDIFINVSTMFYEFVSNFDIFEIFHSITHCRRDFFLNSLILMLSFIFKKTIKKLKRILNSLKISFLFLKFMKKLILNILFVFLNISFFFFENLFKDFEHFIENNIKINVINSNTINDNVVYYVFEMFANIIDFVLFDKILTCVNSKFD